MSPPQAPPAPVEAAPESLAPAFVASAPEQPRTETYAEALQPAAPSPPAYEPPRDTFAAEVVREFPQTSAPLEEPAPALVAEPTPALVAEPAPALVAEPTPALVAEPAKVPEAPSILAQLKLEWPADLVQIETDPEKARAAALIQPEEPAPAPRRERRPPPPVSNEPLIQVETRKREGVAEAEAS